MGKGNGTTRGSSSSSPRELAPASGDNEIKSFLLGYTPKEEGFTSGEEMELIGQKLNLANLSNEELQSMRNKVVKIYSDAQEKEIKYDENGNYAGRTDKYWELSEGMMSVTAVIDDYKYRRRMPV